MPEASRAARQWSLQQRSGNPEPRERSGNALFCILGFLCELIESMEHHVAVDGVVPRFGAPLLIDGATDVLDAVEDIKAVEDHGELTMEETP